MINIQDRYYTNISLIIIHTNIHGQGEITRFSVIIPLVIQERPPEE